MPRLQNGLRQLHFRDSRYFECLGLWICYRFQYIRSLNHWSLFSPHAGKYGPEQLLIRTIFTQRIYYSYKGVWIKYFIEYIWQSSEYTSVSKYARVLKIPRFWAFQVYIRLWRKHYIIYAWQGSEYSSGPEYTRVLNMPGLQ